MATNIEKRILIGGFGVAACAFVILANTQSTQIEQQRAANPEVVEACSKIAAKAHGSFSKAKEISVMEECLVQRDPVYAASREAEMCRQAKASGAKPDAFADEFRKNCFGNG